MGAAIITLLHSATRELANSSPSPRLDAEILLANVLEMSRTQLHAHPQRRLESDKLRHFAALVVARRKGRPVAYLTGARDFWSLTFKVTAATLIPRPETELLVEEALRRIPANAHWYIADLGTGSGAVALVLAKERPNCTLTATDISQRALEVARDNARTLGLKNVEFQLGSWFTPLVGRRFAMIVTNPPYVPDADPHLQTGDVRFEPRQALSGGPDGLAAIRRIILRAPVHLEPGGWFLTEHGYDQDTRVCALLSAGGFSDIRTSRDLAGHGRVTMGRFSR